MKHINFIAGLPRSGSTMLANILKQNPKIDSAPVSSLCSIINAIHSNWENIESNKEFPNETAKIDTLNSVLFGYHKTKKKDFIFDKDRMWISKIPLLEEILQKNVKILCPVRNPAEILTSFEKLRRNNPSQLIAGDSGHSTIAARCMFYSNPDGILGLSHALHKDAITMGFLDRMLFVDYNRFCNSPKSQLKRIYDFFEIPSHEHDLKNIVQTEIYNDLATGHPNLHKIKPSLEKTTTNCVEYLGLDLYQQYNREIFWDAWI